MSLDMITQPRQDFTQLLQLTLYFVTSTFGKLESILKNRLCALKVIWGKQQTVKRQNCHNLLVDLILISAR